MEIDGDVERDHAGSIQSYRVSYCLVFVPCRFMRMHSRQFATKPCLDGLREMTGDFGGRAFRPH